MPSVIGIPRKQDRCNDKKNHTACHKNDLPSSFLVKLQKSMTSLLCFYRSIAFSAVFTDVSVIFLFNHFCSAVSAVQYHFRTSRRYYMILITILSYHTIKESSKTERIDNLYALFSRVRYVLFLLLRCSLDSFSRILSQQIIYNSAAETHKLRLLFFCKSVKSHFFRLIEAVNRFLR